MAYRMFRVPAEGGSVEERELNGFLATQRIVRVDKQWWADGAKSCWAFCVEYLATGRPEQPGAQRVDYKEVLSEEHFEVFARLRQLRKEIAESEGKPVFAVFTNEQLAEMVRRKSRSATDLERIPGVGKARSEKYAEAFLRKLSESDGREVAEK